MKITRWSFNNLHVPMIQDDQGNLYCTTKTLAEALDVSEQNIRRLPYDRPEDFAGLSASTTCANSFLKNHKVELGIKRVKSDMKLWSEDEMIMAAIIARSSVGTQFRKELLAYIKENAKKSILDEYVHKDEHSKLAQSLNTALVELGRMTVRMESLERLMRPEKFVKLRLVQ